MNIRHVFNALLLFGVMSCVVELGQAPGSAGPASEVEDPKKKFDGYGPDSYPVPSHPDDWGGGTEIIEAKGPDGSIYLVEVPIPCDPRQDKYVGCPPEKLVLPEQTK